MTGQRRQNIFSAPRYRDAWGAIDFLERCFGFERQAVYEGPDHTVAHAELRLGTASFGLNSATGPTPDNPWTTVRVGVYVALPDGGAVDAHHARSQAEGAEIAMPLRDTDYGAREYSVWDAERHLWSFGTYSHAVPGEPSLFVGLRYRDGPAAIDWLTRAFGFEKGLEVPGPGRTVRHAELRLGDGTLMLSSSATEDRLWGADRQATYIYVADPDAHHARASRGGATILQPPADTPYGARAYYARDLEGFLWGFTTYRPTASA